MNDKLGTLSLDDIIDIHNNQHSHCNDGEIKENFGIVAILDVLGWKKNATEKTIQDYISLINNLRLNMYDTYKRCVRDNTTPPNFTITTLSDTIAILIDGSYPYHEFNIFNHISSFITSALEKGFMFRGAISRGKYYTNILNNVFVGQPFFEAATYAEATNWAGVIITDSLSSALFEKNSLTELQCNGIRIMQYNDIPYKKNIRPCKDSLVIVPENRRKYVTETHTVESTNFTAIYENLMYNEKEKLTNTKTFINFVEMNFWTQFFNKLKRP